MRLIISILSGLIFGIGLILSSMVNPAVVRGFLDFAGNWNPSLAFVLGGAVCVSIIFWRIRGMLQTPICEGTFPETPSPHIDRKLVLGSAIFGIGWGLVGVCPGPAIVGLSYGNISLTIFVFAMLFGMFLQRKVN